MVGCAFALVSVRCDVSRVPSSRRSNPMSATGLPVAPAGYHLSKWGGSKISTEQMAGPVRTGRESDSDISGLVQMIRTPADDDGAEIFSGADATRERDSSLNRFVLGPEE